MRKLRSIGILVFAPVLALLGLVGCGSPAPTLQSTVLVSNLTIPWDLTFAPSGLMFFTERGGAIKVRHPGGGTVQQLNTGSGLSDLFANGETGLMAIVVDPQFTDNRRMYTCQGYSAGGVQDVRVYPWVLSPAGTTLTRQAALVTGMPSTTGRHGGCRLRFANDGRLWIATGDAAVGTVPQDLTSLGGKVLRVDRLTGAGVSGNPFFASTNVNTKRIWSSGHRNLQGLALRPKDGSMWTAEHGPSRDDEINRGVTGNFGWDPVPGYDESTPMTDLGKFPTAVTAAWSSGFPTIATSGATWLTGAKWGAYQDHLAVAALKDSSLRIYRPSANGITLTLVTTLYDGTFGRLRTAQLGPDGNLYLTTSNGSATDQIIRITPSNPK